MAIEHVDLTSIHRFAYVSNVDPGAVGAYKAWVDTSGSTYVLKIRNSGNTAWTNIGAIFTGSNIGTGTGIFKQVNGTNFEFKKIEGGTTNSIVVANHPSDTDSVGIDLVPGNVTLSSLSGNLPATRITTSTSKLLGRYTAGSGTVQEITLGNGMVLNTTLGILDTANYSIYTASDVNVADIGAPTNIVQTPSIGSAGTYALEVYIPVTNGTTAVGQFYFTSTASIDYYSADWMAVSSQDGVVNTPVIKTMKSFDISEVFNPVGLENLTGYIVMEATIVVGVTGKLTLVGYYDSVLSNTVKVYRGARMVITRM